MSWYRERLAEAEARTASLQEALGGLSRRRTWTFLAAVIPLLLLETSPRSWWPLLLGLALVAATAFVFFLVRHRRTRRAIRRAQEVEALQREGLARLAREFDALPRPDLGPEPTGHPWAGDLAMLGPNSLGHLLGTVRTAPGRAALRHALLAPRNPPPDHPGAAIAALSEPILPGEPDPGWEARRSRREDGVRTLAEDPDFLQRVQLAARLRDRPARPSTLVPFLDWARGEGWSEGRRWALPLARTLALLNPALIVIWLVGWLQPPFWVLTLVVTLWVNRRISLEAHTRFDAAEGGEDALRSWAALLDVAAETEVVQVDPEAADALRALRRVTDWAGVRRSGLTHFPLAALFAWDIHHLERLERWRDRWGDKVDGWITTLGELELLVSLAVLRFDHPSWSFGEAGEGGIVARELRHPLLPPDEAVPNDVEVPDPGGLLLVTGSNMSGKSTLLRAIGANQVLFLMGGPVAANHLRTPPIEPFTSMRIQDSLSQGVSFFLAELHRLRDVVEGARSRPTLVLLDEILQGTNTAERRIAARIILRHLIDAGAIGAVSTHDLTLGREPAIADALTEVHLREDVLEKDGKRTLSFDHRLREGPATSKNALLLLDMVGLGT